MYTHHWAGAEHFINMPFWVPALFAALVPFVILFIGWSILWKGLALWHAARRGEHWWFVALLVINTFGILEIIYLFFIAKLKFNELFSKYDHHTH
jgi:methionyl-tRNA synthetase